MSELLDQCRAQAAGPARAAAGGRRRPRQPTATLPEPAAPTRAARPNGALPNGDGALRAARGGAADDMDHDAGARARPQPCRMSPLITARTCCSASCVPLAVPTASKRLMCNSNSGAVVGASMLHLPSLEPMAWMWPWSCPWQCL